MEKRIHLVGAGGVAGIGMTRCLADHYEVQGKDESKWAQKMMECPDEAQGENLYYCDMIIPIPDGAVAKYVGCDTCFLPTPEEVELCQNKAKCAEVLGDLAPKVYWIRDTKGAGGAGAQMASEYLPGRNYSCELLYKDGVLIGHFIKERLSYQVKGVDMPLDKKGSSAVSVCVTDANILDLSKQAIAKISPKPNGVYAIDFKENAEGERKITEINPGRFLTASYVYFYSTDYNLPLAMVKAFFNEDYKLGKYPEGIGVIRQTDCPPYVGEL